MHPIVIIGSGMAGYTLAREFRKLNTEQDVLLVCADDAVNYAKPTLSNALAANKTPEQIALGDAEKMAAQLNINIWSQTEVQEIHPEQHEIVVQKNHQILVQPYSKLVLAVGATPIRLPVEGNATQDIHVVNSLIDYRAFRETLTQCHKKRVVILGAGLIGCEFANDLKNTNHDVTVIDVAALPLGRLLPSKVASVFQQKLESAGIQFILSTTVTSVQKLNDNISYTVTLSNGQQLTADLVLSAVGLQSNLSLAQNANIDTSRGIMTNTLLETSQANIYAVGDCAEVNGTLLPYVMPIMQQARALAKTLNAQPTPVHYPAMPVAVKTPVSPLTVLPVPANVETVWEFEELEDGLIAQAFDTTKTLRGFVLLGATAAKQRLTLTKQVPDLIPLSA